MKKWSYSRWSQYAKCPSQYEWNYVLKMGKRVTSHALERGLAIHAKAENYVLGKIVGMPNELQKFGSEFKRLRKAYKKGCGVPEIDLSMSRDYKPSNRKDTDYFIGLADYVYNEDGNMVVIDYKTGRQYPEHRDQGHVYSMALLNAHPKLEEIEVEFWYLDSGEVTNFSFKQSDRQRMTELWDKRIDMMYDDKTFEKTPHRFCGWCNRNKKNGGDCSA